MYISSLMLMALYEDRVRTALRARSAFGAASADAEAAGVRP